MILILYATLYRKDKILFSIAVETLEREKAAAFDKKMIVRAI
jgi:hypothetical protein